MQRPDIGRPVTLLNFARQDACAAIVVGVEGAIGAPGCLGLVALAVFPEAGGVADVRQVPLFASRRDAVAYLEAGSQPHEQRVAYMPVWGEPAPMHGGHLGDALDAVDAQLEELVKTSEAPK